MLKNKHSIILAHYFTNLMIVFYFPLNYILLLLLPLQFLQDNQVQRSLTTEDFNRRLQVAFHEGTSNVSQALVGINIRTGYTHAGINSC